MMIQSVGLGAWGSESRVYTVRFPRVHGDDHGFKGVRLMILREST